MSPVELRVKGPAIRYVLKPSRNERVHGEGWSGGLGGGLTKRWKIEPITFSHNRGGIN